MSFEDVLGIGNVAVFGSIMAILLVIYLIALAFGILSYVLMARGLHTIAKRRGIRKGWLAWIPVASLWILGSISDQYQYVVKGRIRNRRKVLLGLSIASMLVSVAIEIVSIVLMASGADETVMMVISVLLSVVFVFSVALLLMVFQFIALYDLYVSCEPGNGVLYLVLSILINVTTSFFVFACRNKDEGMPQRKPAAPVIPEPAEEAAAPVEQEAPAEAEEIPEEAEAPAGEAAPEETSAEE